MNRKTIFIALIIFFAAAVSSFAQQQMIPKIGLINYSAIVKEYVPFNPLYDEIKKLNNEYEKEVAEISDEIKEMEEKRDSYLESGMEKTAKKLDEQITNKKNYLVQFSAAKNYEIEQKKLLVSDSTNALEKVINEIQYIAESEGYSVIFDSNDKNIIWWSQSVDITELVIKRLKK